MYHEFKQELSSEPHEQMWNTLFYPFLFTYSLFAASFISLLAVLFFLLIVSLSTKTPHLSLPTDFLSLALLFSYSYQFLLCLWLSFVSRCSLPPPPHPTPTPHPPLSLLCIISLPCLASCPKYKSWTSSPVPSMTYKVGILCNGPFPAVRLYRSSKLHSRTST